MKFETEQMTIMNGLMAKIAELESINFNVQDLAFLQDAVGFRMNNSYASKKMYEKIGRMIQEPMKDKLKTSFQNKT